MVEEVTDLCFIAEIEAFCDCKVLARGTGEGNCARSGEDTNGAVPESANVVSRCGECSDVEPVVAGAIGWV